MDAKIQKTFKLIVGTNDESKSNAELINMATKAAMTVEIIGNSFFDLRFHLSVIEDKTINKEEVKKEFLALRKILQDCPDQERINIQILRSMKELKLID